MPQLISFPLGRLCAYVLPRWTIFGIPLNPGPFTVKEHVVITIMGGVGAASAYATDIIAVQRVFYNQNYSFMYQWMIVMSTQLIGFAMGGIGKRFLVSPPSMSEWCSISFQVQRLMSLNSLACQSRIMRSLQHSPLSTLRRNGLSWGHYSRTILPHRLHLLFCLVLLTWLPLHRTFRLLMGHLDIPAQQNR